MIQMTRFDHGLVIFSQDGGDEFAFDQAEMGRIVSDYLASDKADKALKTRVPAPKPVEQADTPIILPEESV